MFLRPEDYYPPGSYRDVNAPWNQYENDEHEFNVVISQSLSKETTVWSKDYIHEQDEETGYCSDDTSEINWNKEYDEQHYTPLELINILKEIATNDRDLLINDQKQYKKDSTPWREYQFKINNKNNIIKECEGWSEDETVIEQN